MCCEKKQRKHRQNEQFINCLEYHAHYLQKLPQYLSHISDMAAKSGDSTVTK